MSLCSLRLLKIALKWKKKKSEVDSAMDLLFMILKILFMHFFIYIKKNLEFLCFTCTQESKLVINMS